MADGKIISFVGRPSSSTYQIKRGSSYANSVSGDISTKFGDLPDFFNDFGCDRSGVTDDTTRANNALASIAASGKSLAIKIPGNCKLSVNHLDYSSLPNGITIVGEGRFSALNFIGSPASNTTGRIDVNGIDNWALDNLFIQGNVTSPLGVDYANIVDPMAALLVDGVTPGLPSGSSLWVRNSKNWEVRRCWFNNSGGYSIAVDARSANGFRGKISHNIFSNCRPHLFGTGGLGLGLAYGSWTGGIHYESDGTTYTVDDLLVELNRFYQMAGHCFWGHAAALTKLNTNIRFTRNYAIDHALDMCEMGVVDGFEVAGNKSRRCGYYSATDDAVGVPRWGGIAPAAIDHTGVCINGLITFNEVNCFLGTGIDGDGLGSSVVSNNKLTSAFAANDPHAQIGSVTPAGFATGTNNCKGYNQNNSNDDSRASTGMLITNNQIDGCGINAISVYTLHDSDVSNNHGSHPTYKLGSSVSADNPIAFGPATGANRYCRRLKITGNKFNWSPTTNAPIVAEDSQYAAFAPTDINYVYDNVSLSSSPTFPSIKDGLSGTTTGPTRISTLTPPSGGLESPGVAEYVLQTEHTVVGATDAVLKIYKHIGLGSWVGGFAWKRGQSIVDSASHVQTVTTAGTSGGSLPTFNHVGSTTADGSVVWTDHGLLANNLVAYFSDTTAGIPSLTISGSGAIDSARNFTGHSLTIQGATTSGATAGLLVDSAANMYGRSLILNNNAGVVSVPYGRITNSSAGVTDNGGTPTMGGSINWQESGGGYVAGMENTLSTAGGHGLIVKTGNAGSGTRVLTLNAAGSDQAYVQGDGFLSAKAFGLNGNPLVDASANVFGRSLTLGSPSSSYDLITNSSVTVVDSVADGTTHGFGITWRNAATGYLMGLENTNNVAHSNGLIVKVRDTTAATRVLDLNVNGTDVFVVMGDGSITGNFSFSTLTMGSLSSFSTTPLTIKSPGAFDYSHDYSPTVILLNCASTSVMSDLHLSPAVGFNTLREAGLQINVIAPASASNEWEVDGLICNVVTYATPGPPSGPAPHSGGSVAGSFMALSQVTGGTVWAQNWLVRDWATLPSSTFASTIIGLELDMGLGHNSSSASGINVNIHWDNSGIAPVSGAIHVSQAGAGPGYFQTGLWFHDNSCTAAIIVGQHPTLPSRSQSLVFASGAYPYTSLCSIHESNGDLQLGVELATFPAFVSISSDTISSVIAAGSLNTSRSIVCSGVSYSGYNAAFQVTGDGDLYSRSITQRPTTWQISHSYTIGTCIIDPNGNVQIALNNASSFFSLPTFTTTVGNTTTEATGLQWRNIGAAINVIDQAGNGRLNSLDIHPVWTTGSFNLLAAALSINGVACIDYARDAGFNACQAAAFLVNGHAGHIIEDLAGSVVIHNVDTISCTFGIQCGGVLAGTNGVTCGGLTIYDGTSSYVGMGLNNNLCTITLVGSTFNIAYAGGGTPGGQRAAGTGNTQLFIRGGSVTVA